MTKEEFQNFIKEEIKNGHIDINYTRMKDKIKGEQYECYQTPKYQNTTKDLGIK